MNQSHEAIAQDIFLLGGQIEDYGDEDLIPVLQAADDLYYNDHQSFLSDKDYDTLYKYANRAYPTHQYFIGVGANVRGGKVTLPYQMGSLDQVEIGGITDWVSDWSLQHENIVVTDKLDGTSAMVVYDENGNLQIAYSRGNGVEGADITRHLKHIVPAHVGQANMVVRGEVILSKADFPILAAQITSRSGGDYKNARNMVAGLMNAKTNPEVAYSYLRFVAYEIVDREMDKWTMLDMLIHSDFRTPSTCRMQGSYLSDAHLVGYLNDQRDRSHYEIDGLVIDVDSMLKRRLMNPTRSTLNPGYSIKYKVADASNETIATVVNVHWKPSKHAYLKPRVEIEPVELVGVTVTYATGFNAKFIHENKIGPGAKVRITRSGDVIPFIMETVTPMNSDFDNWFISEMDTIGLWAWNETNVDVVLLDSNNKETHAQRIFAFFESIDAPMLKAGNVTKLIDAGFNTIKKIIMASEHDLVRVLGENGSKVYVGLRSKLTNIEVYKLFGAYSTQRGIGVRKMRKLQMALGRNYLLNEMMTVSAVIGVEGFEQTSAVKIIAAMDETRAELVGLDDYITLAEDQLTPINSELAGKNICMTGFRDKAMGAAIEAAGGTVQSAVSGKTDIVVAKDPNSNSGKMKKARAAGISIMGIDEFKEMI